MNKGFLFFSGLALVATSAILSSCEKDVGRPPVATPVPVAGCDTVTYTKHVAPLVSAKCSTGPGCHPANQPLTAYSDVKGVGQAGRIKSRVIDRTDPKGPMPPDGATQLTDAEKQLLQCWLDNGMKEN